MTLKIKTSNNVLYKVFEEKNDLYKATTKFMKKVNKIVYNVKIPHTGYTDSLNV